MTSRSSSQISGIKALIRDERFWKIAFQVIVLIGVILAFLFLAGNLNANMSARGITFGFSFLKNPAGFAIGESLLDYQAQDAYSKAIQSGIVNSLRVMIVGVVLATIVGIAAGVASFSNNWLLYKISRAYVGLVRNIPLLLQLFFWYLAVFFSFPAPRNPFVFPSANLSWLVANKKGVYIPGPSFGPQIWTGLILLATSLLLIGLFIRSLGVVRSGLDRSNAGSILNFVVSLILLPVVLIVSFFLLFNWNETQGLYFKGALPNLLSSAQGLWVIVLFALVIPLVVLARWRTQVIVEQGQSGKTQTMAMIALFVLGALIFLFALGWQGPVAATNDAGEFTGGVTGGLRLTLEYAAIVTGLVFYTGAF
ncbi:MAG: ABC transporter permease subunit, partial [Cyanobacteria bacterium J06626_23]